MESFDFLKNHGGNTLTVLFISISVPVFAINLKMEIEKIVGALAHLLQTEIQMTKKRQQYENCIKVRKKKWVAWT